MKNSTTQSNNNNPLLHKPSFQEKYPNIKAIMILSGSFFVLFLGFFAAANSSAKALRDSGFNNLGYYSLATLYLTFGLASIYTPRIVRKYHGKKSMVMASLVYSAWIISLALTTAALKSPTISSYLSYNSIVFIVLLVAFLSGPGCSLLWIA